MSKRTNNHRWTAQQTATLRQLYPDLPSAEIAAQLGISQASEPSSSSAQASRCAGIR